MIVGWSSRLGALPVEGAVSIDVDVNGDDCLLWKGRVSTVG